MSYVLLRSKEVYFNILKFHLGNIFKGIFRRLSFKQKFRNPWKIEVTESIYWAVFYEWFKAVEDHSTAFGRETEVKRDRKNKVVKYIITFHHLGTFRFHCKEILQNNIKLTKKK